MDCLPPEALLQTAEFVVVDVETNGLNGECCELTEVGAVLVGGGELHDRWESLVGIRTPLSRGIQRLTGITQEMVDEAPAAPLVLPELAELLTGRVFVAHSAAFDRRVLRQAFERAEIEWPSPPTLCTLAMARRLHPLARQRRLAALADSLGIEVDVTHRALADAETCARIFCALFAKLCANATTVGEAQALLGGGPGRKSRSRSRAGATDGRRSLAGVRKRVPGLDGLPDAPGVYLIRDAVGEVLYVGKSVALRSRVRAHFAASSPDTDWVMQAETVDHESTRSELGALVLEHRLIRRLRPPGNVRAKHQDRYVYLRCRLDIAFPILEVAPDPAPGHAVNVGPLLGRQTAVELREQLNSLFGLRHCGRALPRREHPSAYGQMGRCASPCLGDLDPNAYRRRLDAALALFTGTGDGAVALLDHVDAQMREAAADQRYERAAWLSRRRERLAWLLSRLGDAVAATHSRPRLAVVSHPRATGHDGFWIVAGRISDWGPLDDLDDARARTETALRGAGDRRAPWLTPDDVAETRIATTWLAANDADVLDLDDDRWRSRLAEFAAG